MAIKLSAATLSAMPAAVAVPRYAPSELKAGIVHFGVGNFHRAHMAVYLNALFNLGQDHHWAIVGGGVREADEAMRQRLKAQDWLTSVIEEDNDGAAAHVTAAMIDFIRPGDSAAAIERMSDPAIGIVSMTVTEGGYYINPATGAFNAEHADMVQDAAKPDEPKTLFGIILAALRRRRAAGVTPFTVMSCDNLPGNGHVTQSVLTGLARLIDPAFAEWVEGHVACPNGMVDRITPATSERERGRARDEFGIDDSSPIFCEVFKQWVIEDHFTAGRPALEKVGVTFVPDVAPYELMKLRILNGGHAAIAYPGALLDMDFIHQTMEDETIRSYYLKLGRTEIIPQVPPVPDTDLGDYLALVIDRFGNAKIADTVKRVCFDGTNRQPKYILPTALDRLRAGQDVVGLALASALWCRYCHGTTDSGKTIEPNDPEWPRVHEAALAAKDDPRSFLAAIDDVFGEVAKHPAYVEAFSTALSSLWSRGTRATLERYVAGQAL